MNRFKRIWNWAGDRLNPILVKEARQALKSRQFVITFALMLIAAWCWTIFGVVSMGPDLWYGAQGGDMFFGYYVILAFALLVVVPFGAMRSLAGEHEDRTYDLLSITALGPRQIVSGKLGSAALQVVVYLSAISPCLAFTYLLRGIDVPTILFVVGYTVLASLGLAMIGILAGTLSTEKHWQIVLGVLATVGLFYTFAGTCALTMATLSYTPPFDEAEFWPVMMGMLTGYLSYFVLVFFAAAARLMFTSGNRSTALRIVMVVQQSLLIGWMTWVSLGPARNEPEVLFVCLMLLGVHWYAMGVFMTGESPELSPRVKRSLPQSFLGRVFLTWFNPGPGTGYLFTLAGYFAAAVTLVALVAVEIRFGDQILAKLLPDEVMASANFRTPAYRQLVAQGIVTAGILGLSYLAIYLGLGTLVLRLARRVAKVGTVLTLLVHLLLLLLGVAVPYVLQQMWTDGRDSDYTLLQITNVPWTMIHLFDRLPSMIPSDATEILVIVSSLALIVLVANLPGVAREVRQVRVERPPRVAEEDAALAPPKPVHTSPWD